MLLYFFAAAFGFLIHSSCYSPLVVVVVRSTPQMGTAPADAIITCQQIFSPLALEKVQIAAGSVSTGFTASELSSLLKVRASSSGAVFTIQSTTIGANIITITVKSLIPVTAFMELQVNVSIPSLFTRQLIIDGTPFTSVRTRDGWIFLSSFFCFG